MERRIRGILFDLGDTLLDFGEVDALKLFRNGAVLGYRYLEQIGQPLPTFRRYHRRQLRAVRWNYLKSRITGREFSALDLMARASRRFGQDLTRDQLLELAWRWYQPLKRRATVEKGLAEMLADLRRDGLALGVVSNTFVPGEALDRHLAEEGLLELLPVRVYSCDVGYRKPGARIFRAALRRARLKADETLYVGDSPRADIEGANRMGMISVLKDPDGRGRPDHRIRSILEVRQVLAGYAGGERRGAAERGA